MYKINTKFQVEKKGKLSKNLVRRDFTHTFSNFGMQKI